MISGIGISFIVLAVVFFLSAVITGLQSPKESREWLFGSFLCMFVGTVLILLKA